MGERKEGRTGPFRINERVLVPHTDKYYEAKTLKAQKREDGIWYYLLHYQGWNKKWDEWVEAPGMVKFDPKLVQGEAAEPDSGRPEGVKKRKQRTDDYASLIESQAAANKVHVELTAALKRALLEDWEAVTVERRLVPLPRKPSVTDILTQYVDVHKSKKDVVEPEEEVANGLRVYFDKALKHVLLYSPEREQCEQVLAHGSAPSSMYGAEHLIRLFVKLPTLLPMQSVSPDSGLEQRLADIAAFVQKNAHVYFVPKSAYVSASHAST